MITKVINIDVPKDCNVILGQSHFIKTVEDIHECLVNCVPNIKFGLAFAEASGPCLIRHSGNDEELEKLAIEKLLEIGAGHTFLIFIKNAYPINILPRLKEVPEVVNIFAATANPLQVIVAETEQGRGILGVIDGFKPKGVEGEKEIKERKEFLRKIGYKL
ncbi:MAG: adenosine-specific kinase [Candidatus Aenigmatarchaeota archaeon]